MRILPSALFSYLLLGLAKTQELAVEVPTKENFLRREGHAVAVMGNYLYIEGGEISQIVNGSDQPPPPLTYPYPVNKTLAIALNKSWRTDTVTFETIDKGSHSTVRGNVLWSHPDGKRLYSWGGTAPFEIPNTDSITPRLRVFTKDGGPGPGGKWEYSGVPPLSREPYILRTDFGTGASCNGVGLYMSGAGNRGSDSGIATKYGNSSGPFAVQGLVTYNMNSQGWTNESLSRDGDPAFGPRSRPNQHDGAAVCLPDNVGTRGGGLAFFLGGWQPNKVGTTDPQRITFREVFFYDVAAQRAYKQVTSGEPPDSGVGVCAVVAGGKKASPSSYEIFLVVPEARDPGAVYILTVPGFHWFKVPYEGATRDLNRERHRCAVDNRGGRQMIALGGRASTPQTVPHWLQKDPWINGLKVLDLTSLRWGDEYNADAPPYEVPDMVKEWYAKEYKQRLGLDQMERRRQHEGAFLLHARSTADSIAGSAAARRRGPRRGHCGRCGWRRGRAGRRGCAGLVLSPSQKATTAAAAIPRTARHGHLNTRADRHAENEQPGAVAQNTRSGRDSTRAARRRNPILWTCS
ncbi:hypothetical protein RB597_002070 [Gaeumannomyces tritici]